MTEQAAVDEIPALRALTDALLEQTRASRTTVRLAVDGHPSTALVAESLAPGVRSMRDGPQPPITAAPTYVFLERERRILVQRDCRTEGPAPPASLIDDYGVWSQMLAPVLDGETLAGTISVHCERRTRDWSAEDVAALAKTQANVTDWYREHGRGEP